MSRWLSCVAALAAGLLGSSSTAIERVAVEQVAPRFAGDSIDLEVLPKPRQEKYSGQAVRVGAAKLQSGDCVKALAAQELKALFTDAEGAVVNVAFSAADESKRREWSPASEQGYELLVQVQGEAATITVRALGDAGFFYAVQTLKQLVLQKEGKTYLREAAIEDWPSVKYRGVKSSACIENYAQHKLNFGWQYIGLLKPDAKTTDIEARTRAHKDRCGILAVSLNPGNTLDAGDEALRQIKATYTAHFGAGVRHFVMSFDDQQAKLTSESQAKFNSYAKAQAFVLKEVANDLLALDAANRFYLCHQDYTGDGAEDSPLVKELAKAGLPEKLELCWTGTGVVTPALSVDDAKKYAALFGRPATLFYQNWPITAPATECRTGPLTAHDPQLGTIVDIHMMCSNHDQASQVAFLSGLDWAWNSEGYDPARSNKVAARIWAARNGGPAVYPPLCALMEWTRTHPSTRIVEAGQAQKTADELDKLVSQEKELYARHLPLLKESCKDSKFVAEMEKAHTARMRLFEAIVSVQRVRRAGKAVRRQDEIVLDGKLDEAAWQKTPALTGFTGKGGTNPAAQKTTARVLYDDKWLYVALCMDEPKVEQIQSSGASGWKIQHQDFVQLNIDNTGELSKCGFACTTVQGQASAYDFGQKWLRAAPFEVKVSKGKEQWTAEFKLPLEEMMPELRPAPGKVWGFNVIRRRVVKGEDAELSFWSPLASSKDSFSGEYCGTLTFE